MPEPRNMGFLTHRMYRLARDREMMKEKFKCAECHEEVQDSVEGAMFSSWFLDFPEEKALELVSL